MAVKVRVRGPRQKMVDAIRALGELDGGRFLAIARGIARDAAEAGVAAGKSPYGREWAPTREGRRARPGIHGSIRDYGGAKYFVLQASSKLSGFHNSGASRRPTITFGGRTLVAKGSRRALAAAADAGLLKRHGWRLPSRRFLPSSKQKIPAKWWRAMRTEMQDDFVALFGPRKSRKRKRKAG